MFDTHLLDLLAQDGPRHGKPPQRAASKQELASALGELQIQDSDLLDLCWDVARALGVSDVAIGDDIILTPTPSETGVSYQVNLTGDAFLRLAVRTGLYLPGRSWVDVDRENPEDRMLWVAQALCRTRYARTDTAWADVGAQARYVDWFERSDDLRTPTREWHFNARTLLQVTARCMAAQTALTPLLDDVPCEALIAGFPQDAGLHAQIEAWEREHALKP